MSFPFFVDNRMSRTYSRDCVLLISLGNCVQPLCPFKTVGQYGVIGIRLFVSGQVVGGGFFYPVKSYWADCNVCTSNLPNFSDSAFPPAAPDILTSNQGHIIHDRESTQSASHWLLIQQSGRLLLHSNWRQFNLHPGRRCYINNGGPGWQWDVPKRLCKASARSTLITRHWGRYGRKANNWGGRTIYAEMRFVFCQM